MTQSHSVSKFRDQIEKSCQVLILIWMKKKDQGIKRKSCLVHGLNVFLFKFGLILLACKKFSGHLALKMPFNLIPRQNMELQCKNQSV